MVYNSCVDNFGKHDVKSVAIGLGGSDIALS